MTTATATRQKRTTAEAMISSLTTAQVIERYDRLPKELAIEEAALYRQLVTKIQADTAADDEKQAAELLAGKHGWHMEGDLKVIKRQRRFDEAYPDPVQFQVDAEKRIATLREEIAAEKSKLAQLESEFSTLKYKLDDMRRHQAETNVNREKSDHLFA